LHRFFNRGVRIKSRIKNFDLWKKKKKFFGLFPKFFIRLFIRHPPIEKAMQKTLEISTA